MQNEAGGLFQHPATAAQSTTVNGITLETPTTTCFWAYPTRTFWSPDRRCQWEPRLCNTRSRGSLLNEEKRTT